MKKETKKTVKKAATALKQEIKKKTEPATKHVIAKKSAAKPKKEVKKLAHALPQETKHEKPELKVKKPLKIETDVQAKKPEKIPHVHVEEKREAKPFVKKPSKIVQYHGTGGRKTSQARVWMTEGTGKYLINGRPMETYAVGRKILCNMAMSPFVLTNTLGKYDINANVTGGGYCSQIGAVRQAVSKAIIIANPELRPILRKAGLLTRDPRVKERKKYGQKRARKRFQYSKR